MQFMAFNSMYLFVYIYLKWLQIFLKVGQISKLYFLHFSKFLFKNHKMPPKFYLLVHLLLSLFDI